jgi:DNA-binding SARP family transcriptional activator
VSEARLTEALWPEAEGDAAQQSLATTLYRLRRLLGHEAAVTRQEGRVGLDPCRCWVDTWAFERLLARADAARTQGPADGKALAESLQYTEQALALYHGPFLAGEPVHVWVVSLRERLHARLLRHLVEIGRHWEQAGRWAEAAAGYERALEVDGCAEEFYRRLMAAYHRLGRPAEALAVYQRCRRTLAGLLGVEPSPETEALHRALRAGTEPRSLRRG